MKIKIACHELAKSEEPSENESPRSMSAPHEFRRRPLWKTKGGPRLLRRCCPLPNVVRVIIPSDLRVPVIWHRTTAQQPEEDEEATTVSGPSDLGGCFSFSVFFWGFYWWYASMTGLLWGDNKSQRHKKEKKRNTRGLHSPVMFYDGYSGQPTEASVVPQQWSRSGQRHQVVNRPRPPN